MSFLLFIALILGVTVVPVMIGARVVGAEKTGFGAALLGIFMVSATSMAAQMFIPNQIFAFLVSAVVGAVFLSAILGTTFPRALGVSAITAAVQIAVVVVFVGAGIGMHKFAT
jgi:hypothetical protein